MWLTSLLPRCIEYLRLYTNRGRSAVSGAANAHTPTVLAKPPKGSQGHLVAIQGLQDLDQQGEWFATCDILGWWWYTVTATIPGNSCWQAGWQAGRQAPWTDNANP